MYPTDAITVTHEQVGAGSYTFVNDTQPKTILAIAMQQSGVASTTELYCGSTKIFVNYGKDFPQAQVQYFCDNTISLTKSGNDSSSVILTYLPRNIHQDLAIRVMQATPSAVFYTPTLNTSYSNVFLILFLALSLIIFLLAWRLGASIFGK